MREQGIPSSPVRAVLTGGIGSGKSTVASRLGEHGAHVIEADRIGHAILEAGGAAYEAVAGRFPTVVVGGEIDRRALAGIVFGDVAELRELEALTHPRIADVIRRRVAATSRRVVVVELPLGIDLMGPRWLRVIVDAAVATRIERAVAAGFAEEDVLNRVAAQPDPSEWRSAADYVIVNDGTRDDLMAAADALWDWLTDIAERGEANGTSPARN